MKPTPRFDILYRIFPLSSTRRLLQKPKFAVLLDIPHHFERHSHL